MSDRELGSIDLKIGVIYQTWHKHFKRHYRTCLNKCHACVAVSIYSIVSVWRWEKKHLYQSYDNLLLYALVCSNWFHGLFYFRFIDLSKRFWASSFKMGIGIHSDWGSCELVGCFSLLGLEEPGLFLTLLAISMYHLFVSALCISYANLSYQGMTLYWENDHD